MYRDSDSSCLIIALILWLASLTLPVAAQVLPEGGEVIVATEVSSFSDRTRSIPTASHGFLVVWDDFNDLNGLLTDSDGQAIGSEFQVVDCSTLDCQYRFYCSCSLKEIAADQSGEFVVAWTFDEIYDPTLGSVRSYASRFLSDGTPASQSDFEIWTPHLKHSPVTVELEPAGGFVVAAGRYFDYPPADAGVTFRRFGSDGVALGISSERIDIGSDIIMSKPDLAWEPGGEFMVVWSESDWVYLPVGIRGRRVGAGGTPIGDELLIDAEVVEADNPRVATSGGEALVVWESDGSLSTDTDGMSIQARRFAAGSPVGGQFQVNTYTTSDQLRPDVVAADEQGYFLVAWVSDGGAGDADDTSIRARLIGPENSLHGGEFLVNSHTVGGQESPRLERRPDGSLVATWWSSDGSVRAQSYISYVFADSFESGDLGSWSAVAGD